MVQRNSRRSNFASHSTWRLKLPFDRKNMRKRERKNSNWHLASVMPFAQGQLQKREERGRPQHERNSFDTYFWTVLVRRKNARMCSPCTPRVIPPSSLPMAQFPNLLEKKITPAHVRRRNRNRNNYSKGGDETVYPRCEDLIHTSFVRSDTFLYQLEQPRRSERYYWLSRHNSTTDPHSTHGGEPFS